MKAPILKTTLLPIVLVLFTLNITAQSISNKSDYMAYSNHLENRSLKEKQNFNLKQEGFEWNISTKNEKVVKTLDVSSLNESAVNTVDYHFTNIDVNNLKDINLQYDADKFVVRVADLQYSNSESDINIELPYTARTFQRSGYWYLEITQTTEKPLALKADYHVTLVVYTKKYFKNLSSITAEY